MKRLGPGSRRYTRLVQDERDSNFRQRRIAADEALALIGRRSGVTGRWFRAPLHPVIPAAGFVLGLFIVAMDWMDPEAGRPSTVLLGGLYVVGLVYYVLRLRTAGKAWKIGGPKAEVSAALGAAEAVR